MKQIFKITDLTCEACVKLSTLALKKLPGVSGVKIDLQSGSSEIDVQNEIPFSDIQKVLSTVGKHAAQNI